MLVKLNERPTRDERKAARKYGIKYVRLITKHGLRYWVPLHYRKR